MVVSITKRCSPGIFLLVFFEFYKRKYFERKDKALKDYIYLQMPFEIDRTLHVKVDHRLEIFQAIKLHVSDTLHMLDES